MTEPTIDKKVPNGVSKAVYKKVSDIAKEEGKKNKIDTKAEYNKLSEYLAGNSNEMNRAEKAFVQEQLKEYEDFAAEESKNEFMDKVTDAAKELVKRFAKGNGADDKKIDSVQEAEGLLKELDNPQNDFNAADVKYIQQVVADSGVLPPNNFKESKVDDTSKVKSENVKNDDEKKVSDTVEKVVPNAVPSDTVSNPENVTDKTETKEAPVKSKSDKEPVKKNEEPAPVKPKSPSKPKTPAKPKAPTAPKTPEKAEEPVYDEAQKKMISEMNEQINKILQARDYQHLRKSEIEAGKRILGDAKALGLEKTKEYQRLKALCEPEKAEKPEEKINPPFYKPLSAKQNEIKNAMANILISPFGIAGNVKKAVELLKEAKAHKLEQTQEYIKLNEAVNNKS